MALTEGGRRPRLAGGWDVDRWVIIHWFELSTLVLLCLNLWFVSSVLNALKETNRWLSFLSSIPWGQAPGAKGPDEG